MNPLVEKRIMSQVIEEIEDQIIRDDLWKKALQRSRRDEEKTRDFYIGYRVQAIKDQAVIAQALSEEHTAAIIQRYISKVERHKPEEKNIHTNKPANLKTKGYHKKKCFKCGKIVVLEVKPCPGCHCNSFIFCR